MGHEVFGTTSPLRRDERALSAGRKFVNKHIQQESPLVTRAIAHQPPGRLHMVYGHLNDWAPQAHMPSYNQLDSLANSFEQQLKMMASLRKQAQQPGA